MIFKVMTLFPEAIKAYTDESILGRAQKAGHISVEYHNIRDYSTDKHRRVDDTPYGGGYGMVMTPQPVIDCHRALMKTAVGRTHTVYLSPQGKVFDHTKAMQLRDYDTLILLCGHYEGVDQRIIDAVVDEEISIGDYVLTGGELACAVVIDAVSRLLPGVLAADECFEKESIAGGILEHPQYTKPANYEGRAVPEVLTGGNHADILRWQRHMALKKTAAVRPDLLETAALSKDDILYLESLRAKQS